jgi:hypothetical protein
MSFLSDMKKQKKHGDRGDEKFATEMMKVSGDDHSPSSLYCLSQVACAYCA